MSDVAEIVERLNKIADDTGLPLGNENRLSIREAAAHLTRLSAENDALRLQIARLKTPCGNCNGTGSFDYRDHEHHCNYCDGTGVAPRSAT